MNPESKGSWIALYSKTSESADFIRLTCVERSVFLQGFLMAARIEYDCQYGKTIYHLLPGQFIVSLRDLAKQCGEGCSLKIVRRTIDKLVTSHTWAHSRAGQGAQSPSLITFINWSIYQRPLTDTAQSRAQQGAQLGHTDTLQSSINGSQNDALHGSYTDITKEQKTPPTPKGATPKPRAKPNYACTMDYTTGQFSITDPALAKLEADHPTVDLDIELPNAEAWCLDQYNRNGRVIKNGLSFLNKWMSGPNCARKGTGLITTMNGTKEKVHHTITPQANKRPEPICDLSKILGKEQ